MGETLKCLAEDGIEENVFAVILEQTAEVARGLAHDFENIMEGVVEPMFGFYHKSEPQKVLTAGLSKELKNLSKGSMQCMLRKSASRNRKNVLTFMI